MKWIGVLLIVMAGLGFGVSAARRLRRQVDEMCRIERLLDAMCDRLIYSAQPLSALWQTLAAVETLSDSPLVLKTADGICKGDSFYTSFSRAVAELCDDGRLTPTSCTLLAELGATLGHSGLEQQAQLIRHCAERLKKERQRVETIANARARVCPMMGLAGGVCLALLLL